MLCMLSVFIRGDSNEYTQYTIILYDRKDIPKYPHLPTGLVLWLTRRGWNYPCLEQISMAPKMFEALNVDCN